MFIRYDLEKEIKDKFSIKELIYRGTGRNAFNGFNLLVFSTDKDTIAIEIRCNYYYIYKAKEHPKYPGQFFKINKEISTLYMFGRKTYLKTNDVVTKFHGKAFDFTEELVLLALENKWEEGIKALLREDAFKRFRMASILTFRN